MSQLLHKLPRLAGLLATGALLVGSAGRADDPAPPLSGQGDRSTRPLPRAAGGPSRQGKVQANGISIAYECYGPEDRETMLLVMGQGAQLTTWPLELCGELVKRGYRVIIYDNRDVGLSTKFDAAGRPDLDAIIKARMEGKPAPMAYTLSDMARDAVGLLDALGVKKAHIVGVSMGGMIAQLVAADHPEHTLSLTSIMATSGNPAVPLPAKPDVLAKLPPPAPEGDPEAAIANEIKTARILAGPDYPPDEERMRKIIARTLKRSDDRAGAERHKAAAAVGYYEDRRPKLKTIKAPTVVLHGAEDPIVPVEGGRDVATNIPGAELRIIPGMGHDLPVALTRTIADAITSAASRGAAVKVPE